MNKAWFTDKIEQKGLTQKDIAARLDIQAPHVSRLLSGQRRLQINEAVELAKMLDVPLDDILINAGIRLPQSVETASRIVQIHGFVDADLKVNEATKPLGKAPGLTGVKAYRVLRFQTNNAWDGVLLYYKSTESPRSELIGARAIVKIQGASGLHFRYVKKGYSAGHHRLLNPFTETELETDAKIAEAYPVICLRE
jgi:transcriptional regulator with XRE-family HTH domain